MKIELQANSKEIIGDKDVEAIKLADGRVIETDLVVMAVGIRPYTEVAKDSGLDVNRGIVVNDYMQTSDSHIYAVNVPNMMGKFMDWWRHFMNKAKC